MLPKPVPDSLFQPHIPKNFYMMMPKGVGKAMDEFGKVTLNLEKLIQEKGISKTQLSYKAEVSVESPHVLPACENRRDYLYRISSVIQTIPPSLAGMYWRSKIERAKASVFPFWSIAFCSTA